MIQIQVTKEYKSDAHVQHFNRFQKALKIKNSVTFTIAAERAIVPSARKDERPHHVSFKDGKLDCDCESFMYGNVHDKNFACYHIIASNLMWDDIVNVKTN
jgi:hypothetical protein